ncbi:MAG: CmcJ/NvfI family oxidoreductase, partial [Alphaproteobacteria bacterium]|nr:CmcJ/NvfI family oxidoreductase [Alphaproteobacteria bacterium]
KNDLVETDQIFSNRTGEIYHIAYSKKHRWHWASNMKNDEVLLLKGWDSIYNAKVKYTPHGAFELPNQLDSDPPRESIEARVFLIFN